MLKNYIKTLCEAMDCKEPYENYTDIDGWNVSADFGYHFGSGCMFKKDDKTVGWSQYDNELFLIWIDHLNDEEEVEHTYKLSKQPELTANIEEVRNMLPTILADGKIENFPVAQFLDTIDGLNKDILNNYPIYWDKNHEGNREPVMESVSKENLEDCYKVLDDCAKQIGFEISIDREDKKYVKMNNTNYTYFIDFTPAMDKDQLKLDIFADSGKLAEQLVWTINNAHDIRVAFTNLIYPKIEGLE